MCTSLDHSPFLSLCLSVCLSVSRSLCVIEVELTCIHVCPGLKNIIFRHFRGVEVIVKYHFPHKM